MASNQPRNLHARIAMQTLRIPVRRQRNPNIDPTMPDTPASSVSMSELLFGNPIDHGFHLASCAKDKEPPFWCWCRETAKKECLSSFASIASIYHGGHTDLLMKLLETASADYTVTSAFCNGLKVYTEALASRIGVAVVIPEDEAEIQAIAEKFCKILNPHLKQ